MSVTLSFREFAKSMAEKFKLAFWAQTVNFSAMLLANSRELRVTTTPADMSGHKHFPALRVTKGMRGEGSAQLWLRHREFVGAGMGDEGGWDRGE